MEQFRSKHKQTQSEWEAEMSKKVLEFVRSELYMDLRFLDIALGTLTGRMRISEALRLTAHIFIFPRSRC